MALRPFCQASLRQHRGLLSALYLFALLFALPLLAVRLAKRARPLVGVSSKWSGASAPAPAGCTLIHGVSMGEVQLMRLLVPELERLFGAPCLITTSTDTGWAAAAGAFPDHRRRFFPFDSPWAVRRFLDLHRPARVILLELELWPQFLLTCQQRNLPVILLNARLSERSFRGYARLPSLLGPVFGSIHLAQAQNAAWAARLRALGVREVQIPGSLKADLVKPVDVLAGQQQRRRLGLATDSRPIFLVASTSAGEEQALIKSWLGWGAAWRLIICPRHPERGAQLQGLCQQLGVAARCTALADLPLPEGGDKVLIVDEIGHLGALYQLAAMAVVGGSLGSGRHGQNMLEAVANGCCTIVGWDTSNFPDAMALLRAADGVVEMHPETIDTILRELATDPDRRACVAAAGRQAWMAARGAAARAVHGLDRWQKRQGD